MTQKRTLGRMQLPQPGNKDAFALGTEREEEGRRWRGLGTQSGSRVRALLFRIATEVAFTANSLIQQMSNVCWKCTKRNAFNLEGKSGAALVRANKWPHQPFGCFFFKKKIIYLFWCWLAEFVLKVRGRRSSLNLRSNQVLCCQRLLGGLALLEAESLWGLRGGHNNLRGKY